MEIGNIVYVENNIYSIGKIVNIYDDETVDIKFFINISSNDTQNIKKDKLINIFLGNQTRVYIFLPETGWRIGRVIDHEFMDDGSIEYEIRFSGGSYQEWFKENEIEVKSLSKLEDPTDVLAYSYGESQFLHDARYKILNWMTNLRSSVKGLTALSSSSIDLVIHQVNIAKKILSDPIQRYLLSDEVGMGKTIEAGVIARQCLLDSSYSTVLVVVPDHLLFKWEKELYSKFYLDDFSERIEITTFNEISKNIKKPSLLIIDEAHHIVGNTDKYPHLDKEFMLTLAKESEKLLMLTATPGIGNEKVLFNLLEVLEPNSYFNNDFSIFEEKLLKQREQGVFLRTLKSTTSTFLLKRNLKKVSELFPEDEVCLKLSNEILDLIEKEQDFEYKLSELKTYIIETWNLHNRLIRTRRIDCEGWEFQDRGNIIDGKCSQEHIQILTNPNNIYENINYQIENWRSELSLVLEDLPSSTKKSLEKRYITLLEKSNGSIINFKELLNIAKKDILFNNELSLLNEIETAIEDYNYEENIGINCKRIVEFLDKIDKKAIGVLFVDDFDSLNTLNFKLTELLDEGAVLNIDETPNFHYNQLDYPNLRVIIVDRNNEEGIDLQFADAIIHYDIVFNVSRIEQRIGRVDRFARKKSNIIQHLILIPTDNEDYPWINWFDLLVDGFLIFNQPTSDIQLKLEDLNNSIYSELLKYGASALLNHFVDGNIVSNKIEYVNNSILEERKYLDEQYALNQLALSEMESLNLRDIIEDGEYDEPTLENDINYWLFKILKFYKWNIDDKSFEVKWNNNTLVPKQQFWTKDNMFVTDYWFKKFELILNRELTYYRNTSVSNENTSLIRPGHPMFIALKEYLEMEDRGTTFSTFRVVDDKFPKFIPKGSIDIVFKLVFLMDIDSSKSFDNHAQIRRCDEYFPPKVFTLYIDENMNIIEDIDIIETLNEPYVKDKYIDTNLGSRSNIIEHFIDKSNYIKLCREVSTNAKDIFTNSNLYKNYMKESLSKANHDIQKRLFKLEQRNKIQSNERTQELINFENSLLNMIEQYNIKLDSFGMFFLSRYPIEDLGLEIG